MVRSLLFGFSCLLAGSGLMLLNLPPIPRLIGHGCIGAGGDIWAMDESDFPTSCKIIERNE